MDRKSIVVLVVSFVLLVLWSPLMTRIYGPPPGPATNRTDSATSTLSAKPAGDAGTSILPGPAPGALTTSRAAEELVVMQNDEARYTFTSHGGGLKLVELKNYPETVGCGNRRHHETETTNLATLNTRAPVPAFALLGPEALQGDGVYRVTRAGVGVRAEKVLPNGAKVVKEFQPGTNYLLTAAIRFENPSGQPVRIPVQELVIGTATPISPRDDGLLMAMEWYNGRKADRVGESWFANRTMGCFAGTPRFEYLAGDSNVVWAAVQNRFFTMITAPMSNAPAPRLIARHIPLPSPTPEEIASDPKANLKPFGFQTAFLYPELTLAAGQSAEYRFDVFAGPKEYKTLDRLAARFGNDMDLVMGFGFFGFFAKILLLSMNGLHGLLGLSYALCIIVITVIIKLMFWPLTNASTRSMKRMAALQPQMKVIQEKYKDDPRKMQQKMSEFWREHKINPAAGCLPILIQLPIFFGFYTMLQSAIELRGASFLWACDLSQADTVWVIPGLNFPLNLLPLVYGTTLIWQARLTPLSPGVDPMQQKMMKYMPVMFLFILYNMAAGLTLYWTVQNLLTIAQMKITRANEPAAPGPAKGVAPVKAAAPAKGAAPARPVPPASSPRKRK